MCRMSSGGQSEKLICIMFSSRTSKVATRKGLVRCHLFLHGTDRTSSTDIKFEQPYDILVGLSLSASNSGLCLLGVTKVFRSMILQALLRKLMTIYKFEATCFL